MTGAAAAVLPPVRPWHPQGPLPAGPLPTLLTSRPVAECGPQKQKRARPAFGIQLPEELEASAELCVRNTFLSAAEPLSPSLKPFYKERNVQSCPGNRVGLFEALFREAATPSCGEVPVPSSPVTPGLQPEQRPDRPRGALARAVVAAPAQPPSPPVAAAPRLESLRLSPPPSPPPAAMLPFTDEDSDHSPLPAPLTEPAFGAVEPAWRPAEPTFSAAQPAWRPLELAISAAEPAWSPTEPAFGAAQPAWSLPGPAFSAAAPAWGPPAPAVGAAALPSVGSALHASGQCKPCAFLYTKGCQNGASCSFCHLCDSDEKKRRRKAKLEAQQAMRRQRYAAQFN